MQVIDDGEHERHDQLPQCSFGRQGLRFDGMQHRDEAVHRILVTGEENLFLAAEVVVEVPLLHLQRRRNRLERGAVIAQALERPGSRLHDLDARRCAGAGLGVRSCARFRGGCAGRRLPSGSREGGHVP